MGILGVWTMAYVSLSVWLGKGVQGLGFSTLEVQGRMCFGGFMVRAAAGINAKPYKP